MVVCGNTGRPRGCRLTVIAYRAHRTQALHSQQSTSRDMPQFIRTFLLTRFGCDRLLCIAPTLAPRLTCDCGWRDHRLPSIASAHLAGIVQCVRKHRATHHRLAVFGCLSQMIPDTQCAPPTPTTPSARRRNVWHSREVVRCAAQISPTVARSASAYVP